MCLHAVENCVNANFSFDISHTNAFIRVSLFYSAMYCWNDAVKPPERNGIETMCTMSESVKRTRVHWLNQPYRQWNLGADTGAAISNNIWTHSKQYKLIICRDHGHMWSNISNIKSNLLQLNREISIKISNLHTHRIRRMNSLIKRQIRWKRMKTDQLIHQK